MRRPGARLRAAVVLCLACACPPAVAAAQDQTNSPSASVASEPPLLAVLRRLDASREKLEREVRDYTCRVVRRERMNGKLRPHDFIQAKVRRPQEGAEGSPFSVYLRFTRPAAMAGREVLFVEGRNAGKMLIRRGGKRLSYITTYVDPESPLALEDNRHPITDFGFGRLLSKIAQDVREEVGQPGVEVKFFENAKINRRPCTRIAIIHPERGPGFTYHRTELFLDDEYDLPMAFATYSWPNEPGGRPPLVEQYIYDQLKLNVGLTAEDFDRANPEYGFLKRETH